MSDKRQNVEKKLSNEYSLQLLESQVIEPETIAEEPEFDAPLLYVLSTPRVIALDTIMRGIEIEQELRRDCLRGDIQEIKRVLESNNISVNVRLESGLTPLMIAAGNNQTRLVSFLLKEPEIDVSIMTDAGMTALSCALRASQNFQHADYQMTRCLLVKANINQIVWEKSGLPWLAIHARTLLLIAWKTENQAAAMELIISCKASISLSETLCRPNNGFSDTRLATATSQQIALSKKNLSEYEYGKRLGVHLGSLFFNLHDKLDMKISEFLFERSSYSMRGFDEGRIMRRSQLMAEAEVRRLQIFMSRKGIDEDIKKISKDQIKLITTLSLQKDSQGFNLEVNRFRSELGLGCQNVDGDGFCLFRAIARQIKDRNLNGNRVPLSLLPTTMEGLLEKVAVYFNEHYVELMDRIFPPPKREDFGNGGGSEESYQAALSAHGNPGESTEKLNKFRTNFYEYINSGNYNAGGQLINAADWLPQVMSDILAIDIDIYDQQVGGGFRTRNRHRARIGLGRVNNNHYLSLSGNLDEAWAAEQKAIFQAKLNAVQQPLDILQKTSLKINYEMLQSYYQKRTIKSPFFEKPDFMLKQLVEAKKIGKYIMDQIREPTTMRNIFEILSEIKDKVRQEVLKALKPKELEALWKSVEKLEGYESLKSDIWKTQGKPMCLVPKI